MPRLRAAKIVYFFDGRSKKAKKIIPRFHITYNYGRSRHVSLAKEVHVPEVPASCDINDDVLNSSCSGSVISDVNKVLIPNIAG